MSCPNCGNPIQPGAQFCGNCGHPLVPAPATTASLPGPPPSTSGKAITSLIFGCFSLTVLAAIPAVILGHIALSDIKKSGGRIQGKGIAIAGLVLGYMGVAMIPFTLIIAAIAIPNLLRARIAANEASAVSSLRIIDIAQVTYHSTYSAYAPDLQTLGPGTPACGTPSREHGCFLEYRLSVSSTRPGMHGYVFFVEGSSDGKAFFASAAPINWNQTGVRTFCSTEDGVIRTQTENTPIRDALACAALPPLE